jgi:hypothetical protein
MYMYMYISSHGTMVRVIPRVELLLCEWYSLPDPQSSSTLWNYSKCGVCAVESEAGC